MKRFATTTCWAATAAVVCIALVVGPGDVDVGTAAAVVLAHLRGAEPSVAVELDNLVWIIRLPRVLLAAVVGAALGAAGTVTQGLFRNPMAEPGVLGVSMGAATAAVIGFTLGLDESALWVTPLLSALGGGAVLGALMVFARPGTPIATLLLSGIALGALCSAVTTVLLATSTQQWDLGIKVVHWLMGSFEDRSWPHLGWAMAPLVLGIGGAMWLRLDLDALVLGPQTAASLGVDLRRTQGLALLVIAILVGAATALTGVIGFVGLVIPHVARLIVGAGHRRLLGLATAGGAATMVVVDTVARSVPNLDIPPGAITSLLGAPFFLWLLRRHSAGGFR